MEGFLVNRWLGDRWFEGINQIHCWINQGLIKCPETITKGFENMPQAFIEMMRGGNFGKAIVQVWWRSHQGQKSHARNCKLEMVMNKWAIHRLNDIDFYASSRSTRHSHQTIYSGNGLWQLFIVEHARLRKAFIITMISSNVGEIIHRLIPIMPSQQDNNILCCQCGAGRDHIYTAGICVVLQLICLSRSIRVVEVIVSFFLLFLIECKFFFGIFLVLFFRCGFIGISRTSNTLLIILTLNCAPGIYSFGSLTFSLKRLVRLLRRCEGKIKCWWIDNSIIEREFSRISANKIWISQNFQSKNG